MKIIMGNEPKSLPFNQIELGEVFLWDDDIFIRTESVESYYGDILNAVKLKNGEMLEIDGSTFVFPLKYKFETWRV